MADTNDPRSESSRAAMPAPRKSATTGPTDGPGLASDRPPQPAHQQPQTPRSSSDTASERAEIGRPEHRWRKRLLLLVVLGGLAYGGYSLVPAVETAPEHHFHRRCLRQRPRHIRGAAPVAGQVSRVLAAASGSATAAATFFALGTAANMFLLGSAWGTCQDIGGGHAGVVSATMNTAGQAAAAICTLLVTLCQGSLGLGRPVGNVGRVVPRRLALLVFYRSTQESV